jgi:hypothetical protein
MSHFATTHVFSWIGEQWIPQGIHENNQSRDPSSYYSNWACILKDKPCLNEDRAFLSKISSSLRELSLPWDPGGIHETSISQAIAWGQAMFCEGGSVTPIPSDILGFPDMGHGPATLGLGIVDLATRREQQDHGGHR